MTLSIYILTLLSSCSKDTDLLSDLVTNDVQQTYLSRNLAMDDSFIVSSQKSIILDVLTNDNFENTEEVQIVKTTQPENGLVVTNEDKTLTYYPNASDAPEEVEEVETSEIIDEQVLEDEALEQTDFEETDSKKTEDTFTYTVEVENEVGEKETQEAVVKITNDQTELKAFPSAEGFGKYASGGRGGAIFEVTNLNDSGEGSLRWAMAQKASARTIIFRVGGTINAINYINVPANTTIAGETAPGGGILIKNGELRIRENNVIIRHIKSRFQKNAPNSGAPYYNIKPFRLRSYDLSNPLKDVILDHVSASWGNDENLGLSNVNGVTIQNSIFGECSKNVLAARSRHVSFLNNFLALGYGRNLLANHSQTGEFAFEFINNIVYGYKYGTSGGEGQRFSVINNKYVRTKDESLDVDFEVTLAPTDPENGGQWGTITDTKMYISGNNIQTDILTEYSGYSPGSSYAGDQVIHRKNLNPYLIDEPYESSGYVATSANDNSLDDKLLSHVGSSITRDAVDARYISSYHSKSGRYGSSGSFPNISSGSAYTDTDNDGIADNWEQNIGGTVGQKDNNGDHDGDGYTNLEEFLHFLAQN
ncbi:hypothetical protein [Zobellia roscoffensis]|uniref:hypothetical protein n=1 Tax=Zobellia roscoffensis TaxID=2779508 RepID=UPI001889CAAE|nr:hypothetical protein [Zobellia roscoffensis]